VNDRDEGDRARHYRQRAEEIRAKIEGITDEGSRRTLLAMAADYERMAARIDERTKSGSF
jgi:hypothetical protein